MKKKLLTILLTIFAVSVNKHVLKAKIVNKIVKSFFFIILLLLLKTIYVTICYIWYCNIVLQYCQENNMKLKGLKEIRKKKKITQLKVAMDLSISREVISYYENGKRSPDVDMLLTLSNYFNVSIDYLIKGEEFKKNL